MRVGIFGGSFNPVHNGHLRLAQCAIEELGLEKVIFVPSYRTPLKAETLLPAALRVELLRIALKKHPRLSLSQCEIERKGPSFTIDTIRYFRKRFGKQTALYFLSGADTLKNIHQWKSLSRVLKLSRFVVMTRPGHSIRRAPTRVSFVGFEALPISSSQVRARLKKHLSVRRLVPTGVEAALKNYYDKR